ncbi:MAG: resuscitation-promoting factor RpfB [Actinomycetota bacterium]|jgi:peptidoglycan hydrolase CwlO-like protein|nr:resuscitation-promoting factor RpfB [Actinomycetota bacterium]
MTAPPRRSILLTTMLTVLALVVGAVGAGADEIGDKQAEAEAVAGRLADQARAIVALDKEHRAAEDRLGQVQVALDQAQTELAGASTRQEEARRLLVAHAQAAYVTGGSISFVGNLANGAAPDGVARNTYMRLVTGEDRQAVGRMRAAREDLEIRRTQLDAARRKAADQADTVSGDLEELQHAMTAQRAQVAKVDGELATLVVAEQARAEEAARQERALRDAEAAAARAKAVPTAAAAPSILAAASTPAPGLALSMDEAFACIRQLESGNNYSAPGGGAYQFLDATWGSLGYSGSAQDHPPTDQDDGAHRLQARSGWGQWTTASLCGLI